MHISGHCFTLTYDWHSLAHIIEVKNSQKLVDNLPAHLHDRDGLWCALAEHEPEVSCCGHQSALIRGLSLIEELACQEIETAREERKKTSQCFHYQTFSNFTHSVLNTLKNTISWGRRYYCTLVGFYIKKIIITRGRTQAIYQAVIKMSNRGHSPSFFSSGMTVWHRASKRKKFWASRFPSFTVSTRLWSWKSNFGSASRFQEKSTFSVFCREKEAAERSKKS